jgi:PucR family transcriptional regulator, purine catabolism regulatory protein
MLTLAEVLELPVVRRALPEVIVGADALERELRWAHVIEMADPSDLLKGGELVLTTGIGAGTQERDQTRWIATLVEQGPAAVMVELGTTWRERVPDPVVRACADADVPLVPCTPRCSTASSSCCGAARRSTAASPS